MLTKDSKNVKLKEPAIVLGGDSINALAVARNLGANGVEVIYVTEKRNAVTLSRYCRKFHLVPEVERSNKALLSFLSEMETQIESSAVVFPCSDLFCLNLAQIKAELGHKYIFLADKSAIETLVEKRKFYCSLDKNKVPHPLTYFPNQYKDVRKIGNEIQYPALIKPSITQLFAKFGKKGLIAWSKIDLERYCKHIMENSIEFVIQEIIPGPPTNLFGLTGYLDRNHDPKGLFVYQRIREWPMGFGCNSLIESVPIDFVSALKRIALPYLRKIGYSGLFEAEFKRDSRDGSFKLIEINGRSWWQNHFPTVCGINLVMKAYLDAIGAAIKYEEEYETGVKWVFPFNDLLSSIYMFRRGHITFGDWLSSYRNLKDYAYFDVHDPLPWLGNALMTGPVYFQSFLKKIGRRTSYDKIPDNMA